MCWLIYSWWKNISQSWSFLTNPCIYSIPNSMTSGCLASDCRNISCTHQLQVVTQYLQFYFTFLPSAQHCSAYRIYYKEPKKQIQPGKLLSIFLIWIIDRWMNRWKQQQNIYRVMKTEKGKTFNNRHAWNIWETGFHGHPYFFFYILFVFLFQSFPTSLSVLSSLSLSGSSVWLFIGNDSHCGRAPLRLRSPPTQSFPILQSHPPCIIHGCTIKWGNYGW